MDTAGSDRQEASWLLLIHQIPAEPAYFRVKVARRLKGIGAVALKSSVYVLPARSESREDFHWLLEEIVGEGGEATLCTASFLEGVTDAEIEAAFRREREGDYDAILEAARALGPDASRAEIERLRKRLADVAALDFFGSPLRAAADHALAVLDHPLPAADGPPAERLSGRTWVTRRGVHVDRMASAWLIRRFVDSEARFEFVSPDGYEPEPGKLRFDMFEGEFTHEGDRCTFETLLARFGLDDPGLVAVGEIVHDIDVKEDRFGRPETAGVAAFVLGIALTHESDEDRLAAAAPLFDGLCATLRAGS